LRLGWSKEAGTGGVCGRSRRADGLGGGGAPLRFAVWAACGGMAGASGRGRACRLWRRWSGVDGGFSKQQAQTLIELYRTRNGLQHSSAGMAADEVHRQVRLLLRHLPRLVVSYVAWLEARGRRPNRRARSKACDMPSSKVADPVGVVGAIRVLVNARGGTRPKTPPQARTR
jgi:hypothetical protein